MLIALAVALDDASLTDYQLQVVNSAVRAVGGLAVIAGGLRYLIDRNRELAWDKTRFISELFSEFDRNESCVRAKELIDHSFFSGDASYLHRILVSGGELSRQEWRDRLCVDRYLDFFDRLYTHLAITRTLSIADVSSFQGYVNDIYRSQEVARFALEWGYEDVLRFAEEFTEISEERDAVLVDLRERVGSRVKG